MTRNPQSPRAGAGSMPGAPPPKKKRVSIKGVLAMIGRTIATFIMVCIITGCIVACVMAVYVLQLINEDNSIDLATVRMGYTSLILAEDSEGNEVVLKRLHFGGEDRTWVDYENISPWVIHAAVAVEDRRFWEHNGVDWRRTFAAFLGLFMPIEGTITGGGSTITQQLVKNITGEAEVRVDRKAHEILRALDLSTRYSREDILEAYLNLVPLGNGTNGIQAAANFYFGVDASELSIMQSAALVGITQFPGRYNPYTNPEAHRGRMLHVLWEMHDQGMITTAQFDRARTEPLGLRDHYTEPGAPIAPTSYFVDHVINEVISDFVTHYGLTRAQANARLMSGGYRIHTTVDLEMQAFLEEFFLTTERFPALTTRGNEHPQSATVIITPYGRILATVGGIGEKVGQRTFNRATMSRRHPGSAIKPIGPFALGIDRGIISWSTIIEDSPLTDTVDGWSPINWYEGFMGPVTVDVALQRSINTVAAKIVQRVGPDEVFRFLRHHLQFTALVEEEVQGNVVLTDVALSPMSLGALTHGVSPLEMAAAYKIFVNGGYFIPPYSYTRIEDAAGNIIIERDIARERRPVIREETSVIMNRLLQRAVSGPVGTGGGAIFPGGMPIAGKTGTSEHNTNQWFVGFTPHYVAPAWLGFDRTTRVIVDANGRRHIVPNEVGWRHLPYPPPILWRSIMQPLHEGLEVIPFRDSPNVISLTYCRVSGDIATGYCESGTGSGWYKASRIPGNCITCRFQLMRPAEDEDDSLGAGSELPGGSNIIVLPEMGAGAGTDMILN